MKKLYDSEVMRGLATFIIAGLQPGSFGMACMMLDRERAYQSAHPVLKPRSAGDSDIVANMLEFVENNFPKNLAGDAEAIREWSGLFGSDELTKVQMRLEYGRDAWFMKVIADDFVDFVWGTADAPPDSKDRSIWKSRNSF